MMIAVLALALLTLIAFGISVWQRAPQFGQTGGDMAGAFTTGSTLMARHWDREGACKLRFVMYWEPHSIEYPTLASRTPYISYPPGCILPIFFLGKINPRGPSPSLTMGYNLANHAAIAFCLGLLAFMLVRKMGYPLLLSLFYGVLPISLYLWLPSPYYEHQMGYFADSAIILPFVLCVLVELARMNASTPKMKRALSVLSGFVAFWGMFTDWLFAFVLLSVWLARLFSGELGNKPGLMLRNTLVFLAPPAAALLLFLIQLWNLDALDQLTLRFVHRSGMDGGGLNALRPVPRDVSVSPLFAFSLKTRFWETFIPAAYGMTGKVMILGAYAGLALGLLGLLVARIRKAVIPGAVRMAAIVCFLLLAPCILHYAVFKNHSSFLFHFFSVLKLAPAMAVIPFALVPAGLAALLCSLLQWGSARRAWAGAAALVIAALLCGCYLHVLGWQRTQMYASVKVDMQRTAQFVGAHTGYQDVVFSPEEDIPRHFFVYSMKVVHQGRSIAQIHERLKDIAGDYTVNLFHKREEDYTLYPGLKILTESAYESIREEDLVLYRIRKSDFETAYSTWQQQEMATHSNDNIS